MNDDYQPDTYRSNAIMSAAPLEEMITEAIIRGTNLCVRRDLDNLLFYFSDTPKPPCRFFIGAAGFCIPAGTLIQKWQGPLGTWYYIDYPDADKSK